METTLPLHHHLYLPSKSCRQMKLKKLKMPLETIFTLFFQFLFVFFLLWCFKLSNENLAATLYFIHPCLQLLVAASEGWQRRFWRLKMERKSHWTKVQEGIVNKVDHIWNTSTWFAEKWNKGKDRFIYDSVEELILSYWKLVIQLICVTKLLLQVFSPTLAKKKFICWLEIKPIYIT